MPKAKRRELEIVQSDVQPKEDKRIFCRFALNSIPMRFKDLKVGERGEGVCKDLGGGGAGIECGRAMKPKTPLELWLDLPDGFEPLHCLGKVIWSKSTGKSWWMGVAFDKPRLMSFARILRSEKQEEI